MIDGVAGRIAIRTAVVVAKQNSSTRQRGRANPRGKSNDIVQPHNGGHFDLRARGSAQHGVLWCRDRLRSSGQDQNDRSPLTHQLQRLEGRIEQEDAPDVNKLPVRRLCP